MSTFDDRERGEEAKYALDQATAFKIAARRNKLLGLWAADLMGLKDEAADSYAQSVVVADLEEAGEDDVFRKVKSDFAAMKIEQSDQAIREQMARLLPVARNQIEQGES